MRFLVFGVILSAWTGMWWWTYVFHIKGCGMTELAAREADRTNKDQFPVSFEWASTEPYYSEKFIAWRDSIVASLSNEETLLITGMAYRDEKGGADPSSLGELRAEVVAHAFDGLIPESRIRKTSTIAPLRSDLKGRLFSGFRIHSLGQNQYVIMLPGRTLLRFPFDSTVVEEPVELNQALKDIIAEGNHTTRKLFVHPMSDSAYQANDTLMTWRSDQIVRRLVEGGLTRDRIALQNEVVKDGALDSIILNKGTDGWFVLIFR